MSQLELPARETAALQEIGRLFHDKHWSLATSSNYSVRLSREPYRLLITASGKDKRSLQTDDFVIVDREGNVAWTQIQENTKEQRDWPAVQEALNQVP